MNSSIIDTVKSAYDKNVDILITFTKKSVNIKTGDIPQVNMLLADEKPTDALKSGSDFAICGNCELRPINHKEKPIAELPCYVNCGFGPNAIHRIKDKLLETDKQVWPIIRHGAYGDPFAAGKKVNDKIRAKAKKVIAYTHAWQLKGASYLAEFCMASVHSIKGKIEANKKGFRTFRTVKYACSILADDEIVCPNFTTGPSKNLDIPTEHKKALQCKDCGLCDGNQSKTAKNIVIPIH